MTEDKRDKEIYKVVVNEEGMYSIWPADRENLTGWNDVGKSGMKAQCLEYIGKVWSDESAASTGKKLEGGS